MGHFTHADLVHKFSGAKVPAPGRGSTAPHIAISSTLVNRAEML